MKTAVLSEIEHRNVGSTIERNRLEDKYARYFEERPDYRQLVTYVLNKKLPVYNWFKYKEGFSRQLVYNILREWKAKRKDIIFDPFAGCGTTLLACKELGYKAVGLDILPIAMFVAEVKLQDWADIDILEKSVQSLMKEKFHKPKLLFPKVSIIDLAFPKHIQDEILFYKERVLDFEKPIQDFLMLGLMSILEKVSYTSKDGQFLRIVEKDLPSVKETLKKQLTNMIQDLRVQQQVLFKEGKSKVEIYQGDARELSLPEKY
jgi:hypothetical protein